MRPRISSVSSRSLAAGFSRGLEDGVDARGVFDDFFIGQPSLERCDETTLRVRSHDMACQPCPPSKKKHLRGFSGRNNYDKSINSGRYSQAWSGAGARDRTGSLLTEGGILSPLRLPVPPLRLDDIAGDCTPGFVEGQ